MTYTAISLVDLATGISSVIKPRDGVAAMTLDVQPAVRAVSDSRAGADGTMDVTQFTDAAAVTLTLRLWPADSGLTPELFLDEIAPLLAPWRRPALVVSNDQWPGDRQLFVRFDSRTAPVDNPASTDIAISWKVPSGCWTATALTEFDLPALQDPTTGLHLTPTGLHVVAGAGIRFPAATSLASSLVAVPGSLRPPWKARLYGPCTGPKLTNDTTGQSVIFTDALVLAAGQYVELDSAARTANLLSDPAQSQLGLLDFANTAWFTLEPGAGAGYPPAYPAVYPGAGGVNLIRYHPTSGAGAGAVLTFAPAWLP